MTDTLEPLITVAINAPVVAVDPDQPDTLHAATTDDVIAGWEHGAVGSACGLTGLKLLGGSRGECTLWPPRIAGMPSRMSRCVPCHAATGRKRPRSAWQPSADPMTTADRGDTT